MTSPEGNNPTTWEMIKARGIKPLPINLEKLRAILVGDQEPELDTVTESDPKTEAFDRYVSAKREVSSAATELAAAQLRYDQALEAQTAAEDDINAFHEEEPIADIT